MSKNEREIVQKHRSCSALLGRFEDLIHVSGDALKASVFVGSKHRALVSLENRGGWSSDEFAG